jgi:hypothetical protein
MKGRMVDLIEDIDKGITMEQLAPKPIKGEPKNGVAGENSETNRD